MRKIIFYFISVIIAFSIISCGTTGTEKKATTIDELINKYDGVEFKNCDDFLAFGDEYLDVMIVTIDRASEGDEAALEDFDKMDDFFMQFEQQQMNLENDCPEKFEEFGKNAEEKMADSMEKLMQLMFGDTDWDDDADWDTEMEWEDEYEIVEEIIEEEIIEEEIKEEIEIIE